MQEELPGDAEESGVDEAGEAGVGETGGAVKQ